MSLFQKTIIDKYLRTLNPERLNEKWILFCAHFLNPEIQENIKNSKEEQYQGEFLIDLFVNVLGYTKNPTPNFNLTTEYKNVKDSKKADGAIIINEKVLAIIELKGTDTTDLGKIENQAFGYKNNQADCKYVITSNFEKLRFYIDNAIEFLEFNLFELNKEQFDMLYLCLAHENIAGDIPAKIKNESVSQEDEITKKLYKDYSVFKRNLFQNLTQQNPEYDQLELFKKSQKLLDRFLFLFFGEDRGLLPANSVRMILEQWQKLKDLDEYVPLYDRFKKYFGYLNTGFKGKQYDVFAYNGGLFKPDEILDNITIDDDLLAHHTVKLADYNFASDVDVNILGHIFENSLNEIDEIKAQLEGKEIDKSKTKRKKDGVFYTPKYITKYIVENTVGKLCEEKKAELGVVEEDYFTDKKRQQKTKLALLQKLQDYRTWLHQVTIIDPACGSGAFLNEALNFLIEEHKYIDELEAKLTGSSIAFTYHSESILENNLFGVDLNEESVEIAKLSLWLRTAEPNRKLNDLSNNIKCGNSLIDDPEIAGEKAFKWEKEFPQIFKEKNAYHLVFTTHNSRVSERMKHYGIVPGKSAELSLPQEIQLANIFSEIVKNYHLEILAWNVCKDHVHLLLVCTEDELYHQVRMMKSISSKKLNEWMNSELPTEINSPMDLDPLQNNARLREALENTSSYFPTEHNNHLWSQKFFSVDTKSWQWIGDQESGFPYVATHFSNAMDYISGNRDKHQLPKSKELEEIIAGFITSPEEVFATQYKGGFDVVIGNPPYGIFISEKEKEYYNSHFPLTNYKTNLYILFIERMLQIFHKGVIHFIIPKSLLFNSHYKTIREELLNKVQINEIHTITEKVFEDAEVGSSLLLNFEIKDQIDLNNKIKLLESETSEIFISGIGVTENTKSQLSFLNIPNYEISIINDDKESILQKLLKLDSIKDFFKLKNGLNPGNIKHILISKSKDSNNHKPIIWGKDIQRYMIGWSGDYVNYDENIENKITLKDIRSKEGMKKQNQIDFALRNPELFVSKKIVVRKTGDKLIASLDTNNYYFDTLVHGIYEFSDGKTLEALLAILNSRPGTIFYRILHDIQGKVFAKISLDNLSSFPIPNLEKENEIKLSNFVNEMLSLNKELQEISGKFQRTLQREFSLETLSKKLQNWYELSFSEFLKELVKLKINLSLSQKAEWEDYFLQEQKRALDCQSKITTTDKEIDQMVYQLYGLTDEEIEIVEKQ